MKKKNFKLPYSCRIPGKDCKEYWDLDAVYNCAKVIDDGQNCYIGLIREIAVEMMDKAAVKYFKGKKKAWLAMREKF